MATEECALWDVTCGVGSVVGGMFEGAFADWIESMAATAIDFMTTIATGWLAVPSPVLDSPAIVSITSGLTFYTFVFAVVGLLIALGRIVIEQRASSALPIGKMMVNLILVTGVYTVAYSTILAALDEFTPWIVEKVHDGPISVSGAISVQMMLGLGVGPAFLFTLVLFLGSCAGFALAILRNVFIVIVFAFLPTLAAASASESGGQAFRKAQGYLLAFALFKPVAGCLYALGFFLLKDPGNFIASMVSGSSEGFLEAVVPVMTAVVTVVCASLSLPALIRFIVPVAATGLGSAFSGAGLLTAGVAGGAAVVSLAAAVPSGGTSLAAGAAATALSAAPGGSAPGGSTPGGSTPGGSTPGGSAPGGSTPGGSAPGGSTPGGSAPGGSTPGGQQSAPAAVFSAAAGAGQTVNQGMEEAAAE